MAEHPHRVPLVVVLTFLKFRDFDYDRFELELLRKHTEVEVWSVAEFIDATFFHGIATPEYRGRILKVLRTYRQVIGASRLLRSTARKRRVVVLLFATHSSLRALFVLWCLKATHVTTVVASNSGVGVYPAAARRSPTLRERYATTRTALVSIAVSFLKLHPTHMLVAGQHYKLHYEDWCRRKGVAIIDGHSWDYSRWCRSRHARPAKPDGLYAVLLDGAGPMFGSDDLLLRRVPTLTSDRWYPSVCRFFDTLEALAGVPVRIAAHPKTAPHHHELSRHFGGREVSANRTFEMVTGCQFVITRHSTAVAYAIMAQKPILFIYSDEIMSNPVVLASIQGAAVRLGTTAVNVDEPLSTERLQTLLRVDAEAYLRYRMDFLTCSPDFMPNADILATHLLRDRPAAAAETGRPGAVPAGCA